uniref:Uncharacterized protein n=1 Tax=Daphnia galeata TaxID=27404 RepID=A0A8J2RFV9_9CRUS|nr:unnamed protein product [Daphnia galeata]
MEATHVLIIREIFKNCHMLKSGKATTWSDRTVPLDTKGGNQGIISLFIPTDCLKYCSKFSVSPVSSVASVKKNKPTDRYRIQHGLFYCPPFKSQGLIHNQLPARYVCFLESWTIISRRNRNRLTHGKLVKGFSHLDIPKTNLDFRPRIAENDALPTFATNIVNELTTNPWKFTLIL